MNDPLAILSLPATHQPSDPRCFACGPADGHGLGLDFRFAHNGAAKASLACEPMFAGCPDGQISRQTNHFVVHAEGNVTEKTCTGLPFETAIL